MNNYYEAYGTPAAWFRTTTSTTSEKPSVSIQTNVVRLKAGYVAQVLVGGAITWESSPKKDAHKALTKARTHIAGVFA